MGTKTQALGHNYEQRWGGEAETKWLGFNENYLENSIFFFTHSAIQLLSSLSFFPPSPFYQVCRKLPKNINWEMSEWKISAFHFKAERSAWKCRHFYNSISRFETSYLAVLCQKWENWLFLPTVWVDPSIFLGTFAVTFNQLLF